MHFTIQSQSIKLLSGALIFLAIALTLASSCTGSPRHSKGKSGDTAAQTQQEAPFYFDDYQDVQLAAAQKWGITPIASRDTDFTKIPQLEKIESCDLYTVEYLSHSGHDCQGLPGLAGSPSCENRKNHCHLGHAHHGRREAPATRQQQCRVAIVALLRHHI